MRISTASVYQDAVTNFNNAQSAIAQSTNEISSGNALTSPSVNPTASAQVLVAKQGQAINTQFGVNRGNANSTLSTTDGILAGVTNLMQSLESQIVQANSGSLNASDRSSIAMQLQGTMNQLMTLANSTDSNGNYVFSGTTVGTTPYTATSNGAVYNGNQETQNIQVATNQQLPVTMVGSAVFGNIQVSPSAYFSTPDTGNISAATMSNGTVTNSALVTGDNYQVSFTGTPATNYSVTDTSTGSVVVPSTAFASPQTVSVGGMNYTINGAPAATDKFTMQPGNQNIFQVLTNAITALKQPAGTANAAGQTNLSITLSQANSSISASLNNVLDTRDQIGNSMQQISSLNSVGQTLDLSFTTTISNLQDTNLAQAASQLALEQTTYKAAQAAFASTSQLSLLSMLR